MAVDNFRSDPLYDPPSRYGSADSGVGDIAPGPLDSPAATKIHATCMGGYLYERRRQGLNRLQMAIDHDYYDSLQLSDDDIQELTDRGQPLYVYNLVKRACDWVIGTEKRTRIDYKVLARRKTAADVEGARAKTDVLKYVSDVNKSPWKRSQAFRETVISGLGWLECGVRGDTDELPIYARSESWRNILHDSHSLELDGSDMKHLFRSKYLDIEVAKAYFPDRESQIEQACVGSVQAEDELDGDFYLGNRIAGQDYLAGQLTLHHTQTFSNFTDNSRERVKLIECWYRKPVLDQVVRSKSLPQFHGLRYDRGNDDMRHAVILGEASIYERVNLGVFYAIMTEGHLLAMGRSPYRHDQFPFTPIWCYRRGRDNAPYGLIRPIRDPQDGFNARMRKGLFALSAYRVKAPSDAIDPKTQDWEDIRREAGRPDALLVHRPGKDIVVEQDRGLAEGHMKMADMDASLILDSSGVTADNLGMQSNAQSGKAIIAKQSEGASVTSEIFDNLRLANQLEGEKELSLVEQYVTEEEVVRVSDARGRPSWKTVNQTTVGPDGEVRVLNDITATKADFVIDEQDFNVSLRQAASAQLMDLAGKMGNVPPMLLLQIIEMAIDNSSLPDKDEIVKRMQGMTGYQPADEAMTPEEQQQQQQAAQQQDAQKQAEAQQQQAVAKAELEDKLSHAELQRAQAEQALAMADQARAKAGESPDAQPQVHPLVLKQLDDLNAAVQAAQQDVAARTNDVTGLKQQLADRSSEIATTAATERYKADAAKAAAMHAATLENQPMPPEHQEQVADLMQTVQELSGDVKKLESRVSEGEKKTGDAELLDKINQILAALPAKER